jgi:hypothetical protein
MVVTPNSISLSCEVFMRQRWMIRLAFGYLLMGENRAAWSPQPQGLVCMPFGGIRGPIGEEEFGVALAVAARFADRSPKPAGTSGWRVTQELGRLWTRLWPEGSRASADALNCAAK